MSGCGRQEFYPLIRFYPLTRGGPCSSPRPRATLLATSTSLQDLRYYNTSSGAPGYDAVGNVTRIEDWKAGSPQTQAFTYDHLDRILSAAASGGTYGNYGSEAYNYSTIGNLTNKAGMGYIYDASQAHAARQVNGSGGSAKTIVIYAKRTGTAYPIMKLYINGQYQIQWSVAATNYYGFSTSKTLTGNDQIEVVYTNDDGSRDLYIDRVVVDGTTIEAEGGAAVIDEGTGTAAYDGRNVIAGQELFPTSGALRLVKGAAASAEGYDANGNMTSRVRAGAGQILSYDVENRLTGMSGGTTSAAFVYDGAGTGDGWICMESLRDTNPLSPTSLSGGASPR